MNIEKYDEIRASLPAGVRLVAVSKFKPAEDISVLYQHGQRVFGENHAQEMKAKHEILPKDIEWHFIGHLQTNKVKYIAPYVSLIHSIDSLDLLKEVNKQAVKNNRVIPCLLQFHIADEETKFGFSLEECTAMLGSPDFQELKSIYFAQNPDFKEISMGMSEDYPIAVEEGSTLVRIGSAIFGPRDYSI